MTVQILQIGGGRDVSDGRYQLRVKPDAIPKTMAQEGHFRLAQSALLWLQLQPSFLYSLEDLAEVIQVIRLGLGVDGYIIEICQASPTTAK